MEEATFSLMDLPPDLVEGIVSFCDANSLCALDLSSLEMGEYTDKYFAAMAFRRFGMKTTRNGEESSGKTVWRKGLAMVEPKYHFSVPLVQPADYVVEPNRESTDMGDIATHPSSSTILCGLENFSGGHFELLSGENPVCLRDSKTLSFIRCLPNPWIVWSVALCGPSGCEIVVTTHNAEMMACRGHQRQPIRLRDFDHGDIRFEEKRGSTIDMIGSERYLIAIYRSILYVFQPTLQIGGDLLSFVTSVDFNGVEELDTGRALRHACPELPGVFGFVPTIETVNVWKIEPCEGQVVSGENQPLQLTEMTSFDTSVTFGKLAIGEDYIAGSTDLDYDESDKSIRVYCKNSKRELYTLLEPDIPDDRDGIYVHPCMEFVGNLLVATSCFRSMLCVWEANSGTLLRRYDGSSNLKVAEAVENPGRPWNHDFSNVRCMARLFGEGCLSFLTSDGPVLRLWSFPFNWRGHTLTQNLAERERRLSECRNAFDFSQNPAAFLDAE